MDHVAARIAADLLAPPLGENMQRAVVRTAMLRSDEPAPRGAELAGKMASLLAGKLPGAEAKVEPVSIAAAQPLARQAKSLVYLQTEIAAGQLLVTADVYPATQNLWERVRAPVPPPTGHAFASARIDGEVRVYLAPVPLVGARIDRATLDDREIVALACGDVEGDGSVEIVTLSRRRIAIGRARGGRFAVLRSAPWRDFSPISATPLREPIGGVAILPYRPRPALDVGITDRASGVRLDADLQRIGTIRGVPFGTPDGDACVQFLGSTAAATVGTCTDADPMPAGFEGATALDAAATGVFVDAKGVARSVEATRNPESGDIALRSGDRAASLPRAGAQIAIADLDQDGTPEVMTTLDVLPKPQGGADDALVVTTWEDDGTLRERSRTPVPTGVRAVAACPPAGGAGSIVMATPGELWIVR
jgi:hypothetical protein